MEEITLVLENGAEFRFTGRLFSEAAWEDEKSGRQTHHKLYVTNQNNQVHVITKETGRKQQSRAYRVTMNGSLCSIYDGKTTLEFPADLFMREMCALCGVPENVRAQIGEVLLSANS